MQYFKKEYITKRDVIDWLLENGYANIVSEVAGKFTSKSATSYVSKYSLDFETVITKIKESGGTTILAHPTTLKLDNDVFAEALKKFIDLGLDGIEVVNLAKMNEKDTIIYSQLAQKHNILTSSGSDFHSLLKGDFLGVDDEYLKNLIKKIKKTN